MTLRILAVDDSRTMRDMVRLALTDAGFEVVTADDGIHGLEVLPDADPNVIITDINMPRMDGFGFIEAVRGGASPRHKSVPILTLTTESAAELKARARDAGATGWIVKPFNKDKLVAVIKRVS